VAAILPAVTVPPVRPLRAATVLQALRLRAATALQALRLRAATVPPVEAATVPPVEAATVPPVEAATVPRVEAVTVLPAAMDHQQAHRRLAAVLRHRRTSPVLLRPVVSRASKRPRRSLLAGQP